MSKLWKWKQGTQQVGFKDWLDGKKDPFLNEVEMEPKQEKKPDAKMLRERLRDRNLMYENLYDANKNKEIRLFEKIFPIASIIFCILFIVLMMIMVSYLPPVGNASNPDNNEVTKRYIENGLQETGAVNIVTGMILDYRAFDTFGESNVLFIATITVLIMLKVNKKKEKTKAAEVQSDRLYEPKNDPILQFAARLFVPIIMMFGIYVILNGHLSPGGGFSGGAIIGAGLILHLNAFGFEKTERFFTEKTYKTVCFAALSFYCLAKSYSFFTGANHLESHIPLGKPGAILSSGLILPLNICVGLVVACTMYTFYAMFRKGDF